MTKKLTTSDFIAKAISVHGDRYDYSMSNYDGGHKKLMIICKTHGAFLQMPSNHLRGAGCPDCAQISCSQKQRADTAEFIKKATLIHGDRYDYSRINYQLSRIKVEVVCKSHGPFFCTPNNHLRGKGCPVCAGKNKTSDIFRSEAALKHNNKYDYSHVEYANDKSKVEIICREHGGFLMTPGNHLQGQGCPACSDLSRKESQRFSNEQFVARAISVHGDRYDYSSCDYFNYLTDVKISCLLHGSFMQKPAYHLAGNGCPRCGMQMSRGEDEIFAMVSGVCNDARQSDRKTIAPYELDIFVPSKNIAIEFNGIYWHSDDKKEKNYHRKKFLACAEKGIRLISINDAEWRDKKEQLIRIIMSSLGARNDIAVNARDCVVCEVPASESRDFLNQWHVQGDTSARKISTGLRTRNGELVAVMTFSHGANYRGNARSGELPWSLSRYATSCTVRGGAGKLFKHAVREYGMSIVESFSMNNFFGGAMYSALGFEKVHEVAIDYQVYHPKCGLRPKSHWQRRLIPKRLAECGMQSLEFNPDKSIDSRTEFEIEDLCGAKRIWDTGKILWRWTAK